MEAPSSSDRVASNYYREVGTNKVPTAAEEYDLFTRYSAARDKNHRAEAQRLKKLIAVGYLKFVVKRASKRSKNEDLRRELISEGHIGLMVAIDKFDVTLGNRFLTYGAHWIDVYMREFINKSPGVHIPNHKRKEYRRKKASEDKLIAQGILRDHTEVEPVTTSIDNVIVQDLTVDIESSVRIAMTNVLSYLTEAELTIQERFVVIHYYGLRGCEPKNFVELACLMYTLDGTQVSSDQVRQMQETAITKLNDYMDLLGLESSSDVW